MLRSFLIWHRFLRTRFPKFEWWPRRWYSRDWLWVAAWWNAKYGKDISEYPALLKDD